MKCACQILQAKGQNALLFSIAEQIKANMKQYCSNLQKRPNLLNYTFNSFVSMDDLGNSLLK